MTLKQINERIAKQVSPSVELVRGKGYHYYVCDIPEANFYETSSEMVCYTNQMTPLQWIEGARDFAAKMGL